MRVQINTRTKIQDKAASIKMNDSRSSVKVGDKIGKACSNINVQQTEDDDAEVDLYGFDYTLDFTL
jgi:hypothetical protein